MSKRASQMSNSKKKIVKAPGKAKEMRFPKPTILVDSREKNPFKFRASASLEGTEVVKLDAGDYAIKGHEDLVCIERKQSATELAGNLGKNRARFEREMERMQSFKFKYIIVEDHWSSILGKSIKHSRMTPRAVFESLVAFGLLYGVHYIFAGNRKQAQTITRSILTRAYRYRMGGEV
jgi:ERCC4-type nuclease